MTPKIQKAPKMRTTQRIEKKNKVNPKIEESSKVKTGNDVHSQPEMKTHMLKNMVCSKAL